MENEKNVCPICGKPTSNYYGKYREDGLCREHKDMLKQGLIYQCADCGNWNEKDVICDCKKVKEENKPENFENIIIDKGFKCLTCGYETDGKLFCKKCYAKYHNKEIIIKIKNCKEIVPLDDFYEGYYECEDGHVVKSMAEREIDDYLFRNNIKHGYEIPLPLIDDNGKKITLHPDFCIFDEKGNPLYYIEYWGYDDTNRDYTKTKKFKMPLYKKSGITLINVNAKYDIRTLKTNLKFKIENHKIGISNFENE